MKYRVKPLNNDKRNTKSNANLREGKEVYRHPKGYFVVLEFQGKSGSYREAFFPEDIIKVG